MLKAHAKEKGREWRQVQRVAPLGYFAMGIGWIRVSAEPGAVSDYLAIANGSDWSPQPITLHAVSPLGKVSTAPEWFSTDYDHHMGLAVGDLNGSGYQDLVVAVFCGKNQEFSGGGVKVYRGGPGGLDPHAEWIASGFAAASVCLCDLTGDGTLDVVVSSPWETGSVQRPNPTENGDLDGRVRVLLNQSGGCFERTAFHERVMNQAEARGAGDVQVTDIDGDGYLDLVVAGPRLSVLFGGPSFDRRAPFSAAQKWTSQECYPFAHSVRCFSVPDGKKGRFLASTRTFASQAQLTVDGGNEACILVHRPERGTTSKSVQRLACFDGSTPELPSGLAVGYDELGLPRLFSGFLDVRGLDIRGSRVRQFRCEDVSGRQPFANDKGEPLPGGGLMAGHLALRAFGPGPRKAHELLMTIDEPATALVVPALRTLELLSVEVLDSSFRELPMLSCRQGSDGETLRFSAELSRGVLVRLFVRTCAEVELAAASSAAWPPAGATGLWQGRLSKGLSKAV